MRYSFAVVVIGLACLNSGCALLGDAAHLLIYKTTEAVHDHRESKRNRKWAEETWDRLSHTHQIPYNSEDYKDGFLDGFCQYLYSGNAEPPALPPKHYRKLQYQTVHGYNAIKMWFSGYQHGVTVAREKGFRDLVTGPSSLRVQSAAVAGKPIAGQVLCEVPGFQLIAPTPPMLLGEPKLATQPGEPLPVNQEIQLGEPRMVQP